MSDIRIVPKPEVTDGVPFCSSEQCGAYDGKRCRLLGFMPDGICEPAVRIIVDERDLYRRGYEARGKLLAAYRLGARPPSEKVFDDLAAVRDGLEALGAKNG